MITAECKCGNPKCRKGKIRVKNIAGFYKYIDCPFCIGMDKTRKINASYQNRELTAGNYKIK